MDISFPDPGKVNSTQLHLALASFFWCGNKRGGNVRSEEEGCQP